MREFLEVDSFMRLTCKDADKIIDFFASSQYEHYVEQFRHADTLKAKFLTWLSAKEKDFAYEVDKDIHGSPVIKVGGHPVSGLVDFDALLNNQDYQDEKKKLLRKRMEREKYIEELCKVEGEEHNDLWDDISALTKEIEEQLEKDTLALYQNYAKMTLENGYNSRLKRALECIECGELDRARRVLDPEGSISNLKAIENENEILAARIETNKKIAKQEINILFTEIDRLKLDTGNKNRFEEIERCYNNIEYFQEKFGLEMTVLYYYGYYLRKQNKRIAAIEKYTKILACCQKRTGVNLNPYLLPASLNNLAALQEETNRYAEAEANYAEALKLLRELAKKNPDAYLPFLSMSLSNLATLQYKTNRHTEAETKYTEALKIMRERTKSNPISYLTLGMVMALNNLAGLQGDTNRHTEAAVNYAEALKIMREQVKTNSDEYLPNLALTLNNLASLQQDTKRYTEAEANYIEALKIRRELAGTNPDAYLSDVAMALKQLASLQQDTKRYTEAEANYTEALKIIRRLAKTNPDVHLPSVALLLNNLASLQQDTNHHAKAEVSYTESLKIRRKLAGTNPSVHLAKLTNTLCNLAGMQKKICRYEEAEKNYTEAFDIYTQYVEKNHIEYCVKLFTKLKNLIDLKEKLSKAEEAEALIKKFEEIAKANNIYDEGKYPEGKS